MADFKIQHGSATVALSGGSVTITAGTDYTAPSSITKSFIRITGVENNSAGSEDSDFAGKQEVNCCRISNPSNLLTSITFTREGTTNGPQQVFYEIVEYIGSSGGVNEIVVRHEESVAFSTLTDLTIDSSTVSGVSTAADVVVFLTGFSLATGTSRGESGVGRYTWEYVSGSTVARGTRDNNSRAGNVSIAVVEFTGSNWTVQRIEHAFVAGATVETETITTVTAIANAFTHSQSRYVTPVNGPDGSGFEAYLTSATTMSYLADSIDSGQTIVSFIVSNSSLSVERISGSRADNAGGGTDPDTWTEAHTTSESDITTVSIMGECGQSDNTSDTHLNRIGMEVTSTTVVTLTRGRDEGNRDYRLEVVSWPTAAVVVTEDQEGFHFRNDDGSETTATFIGAQDSNITEPVGTNIRLRMLIDATGDPDAGQYQLEWKVSSADDSTYLKIV